MSWSICLIITLIITKISSCFCILQGWEYSAVMFICVNAISLLFIGASYIKMLRAIKQTSAEAMRPTLSGRENVVARRFAVIVATDCACWLPIIIVKMAALAGKRTRTTNNNKTQTLLLSSLRGTLENHTNSLIERTTAVSVV